MRMAVIAAWAALLLPALAVGQKLDLKLDSLASKASEKAEVDLDGAALGMALQQGKLGGKMPVSVQEVHVRNYEFAKPGEYSDKDLEPLRKQLGAGSGWSRIIHVKEKQESTEIYTLGQGDKLGGLLIIACEAAEVSVVHLGGALTLEQAKALVSSNIRYQLEN